MIMPRGSDQLLLPVNPLFLWVSLAAAMLVNLLPVGRQPAMPDVLAVVLVFWTVHQPRRVSIGVAFFFGLVLDVHHGALLGQHALAYSLLSFLAITIHRRVQWFSLGEQVLHVAPLFAVAHVTAWAVRLVTGDGFPSLWLLVQPLLEALLWPVVSVLLLAPQMRAPDPDENRPL